MSDDLTCQECGEPYDDHYCDHGACLCPEHIEACPECRADMADQDAYDSERDDR